MLVSAAVCPHPPSLVPELTGATAHVELDELRAACRSAVDALRPSAPDLMVVVGAGEARRRYGSDAVADFTPWGVDLVVGLPRAEPGEQAMRDETDEAAEAEAAGGGDADAHGLPLSLSVGAWLLEQASWPAPVTVVSTGPDDTVDDCRALGIELADLAERVVMLVMGDGSARRSETGPRSLDPRAADYDGSVADALRTADPDALMGLDPDLAGELVVAGVNPWKVLAGASSDASFDGDMLYEAAPFGVGYLVAVWERHG